MKMRILLTGFVLLIASGTMAPAEDNWPRFRGPNADGVAKDDARLPEQWSKTENVKWVADVPGSRAAARFASRQVHAALSHDRPERNCPADAQTIPKVGSRGDRPGPPHGRVVKFRESLRVAKPSDCKV